jgi:hypothetical protein
MEEKMTKKTNCLCACALLHWTTTAFATVTAVPDPPQGGTAHVTDAGNGKWTVTFDRSQAYSGTVTLNVRGATSDKLRFVIVNDSLYVTLLSIRGPNSGDPITSVDSITEASGTGTVVVQELRLSGDLGAALGGSDDAIDVDSITFADVGGDVLDDIRATNGTIQDFTIGGDLTGDITVDNGSLEILEVGGAIGAVADECNFDIEGSLYNLKAAEIHTNIDTDYNNANGSVFRIESTAGDFTGSLNTVFLTTSNDVTDEKIEISGNCAAALSFSEDVRCPIEIHGDLASNGSITIGSELWVGMTTAGSIAIDGSLKGDITIGDELDGDISIGDAGGLDGQIIINADNNVYTNWTDAWTGDVAVDGDVVTPGDYPDTDLGDGAIGLARFTIHEEACSPANGADLATSPAVVTLRHYGPILMVPDSTVYPHVLIERRPYGGGSWTIVVSDFETDSMSGRDLVIKPKSGKSFLANSEYRFTHTPPGGGPTPAAYGYLKCDQVSTNPALRTGTDTDGKYEYTFKIQP